MVIKIEIENRTFACSLSLIVALDTDLTENVGYEVINLH